MVFFSTAKNVMGVDIFLRISPSLYFSLAVYFRGGVNFVYSKICFLQHKQVWNGFSVPLISLLKDDLVCRSTSCPKKCSFATLTAPCIVADHARSLLLLSLASLLAHCAFCFGLGFFLVSFSSFQKFPPQTEKFPIRKERLPIFSVFRNPREECNLKIVWHL